MCTAIFLVISFSPSLACTLTPRALSPRLVLAVSSLSLYPHRLHRHTHPHAHTRFELFFVHCRVRVLDLIHRVIARESKRARKAVTRESVCAFIGRYTAISLSLIPILVSSSLYVYALICNFYRLPYCLLLPTLSLSVCLPHFFFSIFFYPSLRFSFLSPSSSLALFFWGFFLLACESVRASVFYLTAAALLNSFFAFVFQ